MHFYDTAALFWKPPKTNERDHFEPQQEEKERGELGGNDRMYKTQPSVILDALNPAFVRRGRDNCFDNI